MNDNPAANDRNINIKKCVAGICLAGAMVGAWAQGILVTPPPKSAGPFNTLSAAAENAGLKACRTTASMNGTEARYMWKKGVRISCLPRMRNCIN